MKTLAQSKPKNITLQQYITSHSLQKRYNSKNNSKDKMKSQLNIPNTLNKLSSPSITKFTRQQLYDQIKIELRGLIPDDYKLTQVLKMLERLTQLYSLELEQRHRQNDVLQTILKETSVIQRTINSTMRNTTRQLKNSTSKQNNILANHNLVEDHHLNSININNPHNNSIVNLNLTNHYRTPSGSSCETIPNINVMIVTHGGEQDNIERDENKDTTIEWTNQKYLQNSQNHQIMENNIENHSMFKSLLGMTSIAKKDYQHYTPSSTATTTPQGARSHVFTSSPIDHLVTPQRPTVLKRFQDLRRQREK